GRSRAGHEEARGWRGRAEDRFDEPDRMRESSAVRLYHAARHRAGDAGARGIGEQADGEIGELARVARHEAAPRVGESRRGGAKVVHVRAEEDRFAERRGLEDVLAPAG